MKKFALISFYRSENYGAVLQAYALRRALLDLGVESEYLEYEPKNRLSGIAYLKNKANRIIRNLLGYRTRARRFKEFTKSRIPFNSVGKTSYNGYLIGSDQVWHPQYLKDSDNFFLIPFIDSPYKYSYASSFGVSEIPDELTAFYIENLKTLRYIGVREATGLNIINKLGLKGTMTPDPTLLLNGDDWLEDVAPRIEKDMYIFCYVMQGDHETAAYVRQAAEKLRKELGAEHKIIVMGDKEYKSLLPGYNLVCDAGPKEFLSYIRYADYVITSSFHGTCFSINFNKPLKSILRRSNPVNTRIVDLLSIVGLSDIISYTDENISCLEFKAIDYQPVNSKLAELRDNGIEYLKTIVEDAQ